MKLNDILKRWVSKKETSLFEKRLKSGFYTKPKYKTVDDYKKDKLEKDTKLIEDFSKSKIFKDILTYSKGESKWG